MRLLSTIAACLFMAIPAQAGVIPDRVLKVAQDRVDAGEYPALVIGMVVDGKVEVAAFGKLPDGKAPDGDTVFEIGSITKTFTATLLAEAVTKGEVSLDDPVAKLLPRFTIPSRGGRQITLADIAEQRSGLPRLPNNLEAYRANPYADYDAVRLKAFLAGYALPRDPGASYEYSNLGFGLLGYALAGHAGTDYPTLLQRRILDPLGMKNSGTALSPAMRAHLAPGHDDAGRPMVNWDFDALAGAGAIRSTINDMLLYLRANMGVGKTPLAAAMTLAHTPRIDMAPDRNNRIGLAWMTFNTAKGMPITWHNGQTGGYVADIGFTADGHSGIVILTNGTNEVNSLGLAALDPEAPLPPVGKAIALSDADLDAYTGRYKLSDAMTISVYRDNDRLMAVATGQGPFAIFPSAPNEFFARVGGISMTFTRNPSGAVAGMILHQGGDRPAPRVTDPPAVAVKAAMLTGYIGKYQLTPGAVFDITAQGDQLMAQLTGQPPAPVYPSAKDKFFYTIVDAQLDFERNEKGDVIALTLHQSGKDLRAPRITP